MSAMKQLIRNILRKIGAVAIGDLVGEIHANRVLTAKLLIDQLHKEKPSNSLRDSEFKVFSQWGEDGIIQYLIHKIPIDNRTFVEFGVESYRESNTRFLLINDNWSGLVIDGGIDNVSFIKSDSIYWRHDLKAECAFITKDNINEILERNDIIGDIGLLSVDIDGNDYWVWEAINVLDPRIVVCEYNSLWGPSLAVTIPYEPAFDRTKAHYSNLYFGASITALTELAAAKGYSLVGSNLAGNNVFYVRNDVLGDIPVFTPEEAWIRSRFRESRNTSGQLTHLSFDQRLALVADMPLVKIASDEQYSVGELYGVS